MSEPVPILSVQGLTVAAGRKTILRDVVLDVPEGRVTAVIGPSGAGKSTLLRCLNRLVDLTPSLRTSGAVLFRGGTFGLGESTWTTSVGGSGSSSSSR